MRILFTGTSSAIPSAGNGYTSIIISAGGSLVMVDTGDNPVRALLGAGEDPLRLAAVVLTHGHVDHLGAFPALLSSLDCMKRIAPLEVIAGPETAEQARRLMELFDQGSGKLCFEVRHRSAWECGGATIELRPGSHPVPTRMVVVREGAACLLYTADCRYEPGLAARNADGCGVMVHEATYPQSRLPADTGHSSARQAALAAREAGVKRLFLCHMDPMAWRGEDPGREAGAEFSGEVVVPKPNAWYEVTR